MRNNLKLVPEPSAPPFTAISADYNTIVSRSNNLYITSRVNFKPFHDTRGQTLDPLVAAFEFNARIADPQWRKRGKTFLLETVHGRTLSVVPQGRGFIALRDGAKLTVGGHYPVFFPLMGNAQTAALAYSEIEFSRACFPDNYSEDDQYVWEGVSGFTDAVDMPRNFVAEINPKTGAVTDIVFSSALEEAEEAHAWALAGFWGWRHAVGEVIARAALGASPAPLLELHKHGKNKGWSLKDACLRVGAARLKHWGSKLPNTKPLPVSVLLDADASEQEIIDALPTPDTSAEADLIIKALCNYRDTILIKGD